MFGSVVAISLGASLGALLRWVLAVRWNPSSPTLPLGTLAANLLGGYLVGLAVAYFSIRTDLAPEVRLFVITGFLGGLTTFSTFSAEVVSHMQQGQWSAAIVTAGMHMIGSFALTALGIATVGLLRQSP
jgi:CrcB protein